MNKDMSAFVERYQLLYEKDPHSKVFAPLAEAYRRMGLVDEAIDLAVQGVKEHPNFASGRVALGKCYVEKGDNEKAIEQLKAAVDLSPENLLAHQLLAECYAKTRRPVEALNEFKLVLFLNPLDGRAAGIVKKLEEAVYAGQQETEAESQASIPEQEEEFAMERVQAVDTAKAKFHLKPPPLPSGGPARKANPDKERAFEQELALLDARYDRGDWVVVRQQLEEMLARYPEHPELLRRQSNLNEMTQNSFNLGEFLQPLKTERDKSKVDKLKSLLEQVESRRKA